MKSKAGKISWSRHPLLGLVIGPLIAIAYIALQEIIAPWASTVFGSSWRFLQPLLFLVFIGLCFKLLVWRRFPSDFHIEEMTPDEFAGATPEAVQLQKQQAASRSPLPEVVPSAEVKVAKPELALDFDQLEKRSAELEALGFVMVKEGAMRTASHSVPIYGRLLAHPDGCFGDLNQIFMPTARHPLFVSLSTRFPNRWSVIDSTLPTNFTLWTMRRKRAVGKRHNSEVSVALMWQSHRERCAYVSEFLKQPALRLSCDEYISTSIDDLKEMRPLALKRSFGLGIINYLLHGRGGEWWGELKPPPKTTAKNS